MRYKATSISWQFGQDWFGHFRGEGTRTSTNLAIPKASGFDQPKNSQTCSFFHWLPIRQNAYSGFKNSPMLRWGNQFYDAFLRKAPGWIFSQPLSYNSTAMVSKISLYSRKLLRTRIPSKWFSKRSFSCRRAEGPVSTVGPFQVRSQTGWQPKRPHHYHHYCFNSRLTT